MAIACQLNMSHFITAMIVKNKNKVTEASKDCFIKHNKTNTNLRTIYIPCKGKPLMT
jgi:hypothetical protein